MPLVQKPDMTEVWELNLDCDKKKNDKRPGKAWDQCMINELCQLVKDFNQIDKSKIKAVNPSPSEPSSSQYSAYAGGKEAFATGFAKLVSTPVPADQQAAKDAAIKSKFSHECRYEEWKKSGSPANPARSGPGAMNPDHVHDAKLGGPLNDINGFKWMNDRVNTGAGAAMRGYPADKAPPLAAMENCGC